MPTDEPAWKLLADLKDIVEVVVSPVQTQESIAYLNFKISEHRVRFKEIFPESKFLPKHHFLEHYPYLICEFGPLVALWTMRFEAKLLQKSCAAYNLLQKCASVFSTKTSVSHGTSPSHVESS